MASADGEAARSHRGARSAARFARFAAAEGARLVVLDEATVELVSVGDPGPVGDGVEKARVALLLSVGGVVLVAATDDSTDEGV